MTSVIENSLTSTLLSDVGGSISSANVYSYASIADNGLLIDGSVMFPVFNNTLISRSPDRPQATRCMC